MTLVNDSVLVTPGAGATVATHAAGGKEHQAIVEVDHNGHLVSDPVGIYFASALAVAKGASKNILSIFNADAALIVDLIGVWVSQEVTAAVTGLVRGYRLFQLTAAHSAGTAVTATKADSTTGALDSDITILKDGQTAAPVGDAIASVGVGEEETGAGGANGRSWLHLQREMGFPLPLRQNQGYLIQQDGTAGTGVISAGFIFRVR